jgi:hypothetical protein
MVSAFKPRRFATSSTERKSLSFTAALRFSGNYKPRH